MTKYVLLYLSLDLNSLGNLIEYNKPAEGKFDTYLSIYKFNEIPAGFTSKSKPKFQIILGNSKTDDVMGGVNSFSAMP